MKRKASEEAETPALSKRRANSSESIKSRFRNGLFDETQLKAYTQSYADSKP